MNKDSGKPFKEFSIILGSIINKIIPINAYFFSKNFLRKKYSGIIVKTEIIIVVTLWILINSRKYSEFATEKIWLKINGQKLFGKEYPVGIRLV